MSLLTNFIKSTLGLKGIKPKPSQDSLPTSTSQAESVTASNLSLKGIRPTDEYQKNLPEG